jgi:hypothetical protein
MVRLQDSILKFLHHHALFSILSNGIFKTHRVQILSCFGRVSVWFTFWPIFPNFQLASLIFSTSLQIQLWLPYPSIASIFQCVCTHPIDLLGIHLLRCVHGNEHIGTHDAIRNTFVAIVLDVGFHMGWEQLSFKHIQLLPLTSWHCAHQRWHLHLSRHCHCQPNTIRFTSPILRHLRICCFQCGSSQITKLLRRTPYRSIPPLSNGSIWMFT